MRALPGSCCSSSQTGTCRPADGDGSRATCGIGLTLLFLAILVSPDQGADYGLPQLENPLTVPALDPYADALVALVVFAPLTIVGGAVAVIGRLRRTTDPVQRRQLRWLAWAAGVIAFTYVMAFAPQADPRVRRRDRA